MHNIIAVTVTRVQNTKTFSSMADYNSPWYRNSIFKKVLAKQEVNTLPEGSVSDVVTAGQIQLPETSQPHVTKSSLRHTSVRGVLTIMRIILLDGRRLKIKTALPSSSRLFSHCLRSCCMASSLK